jgi:hypothetical protein
MFRFFLSRMQVFLCQTDLSWNVVSDQPQLKHNGPAIKGGCVTWRSHPATRPGTLA